MIRHLHLAVLAAAFLTTLAFASGGAASADRSSPGASAVAPSSAAKQRARRHYEQAEAYRKAGTYDKAIDEYLAAYREVPGPGFLFDVGLVYEQMGQDKKAVEYYDEYLAAKSKGSVADEAKARVVALQRKIAAEEAAQKLAAQKAEAEAARAKQAEALRKSAGRKSAAGDHAGAASDLRQAQALSSDPEMWFDVGHELEQAGDKKGALVAYQRYRADAPAGPRIGDAVERSAVLEREIATEGAAEGAAEGARPGVIGSGGGGVVGVSRRAHPRATHSRNYKLLIVAGLAAAAGVALDNLPASAHNGSLDPLDLAPVGLYGLSGVMVALFVF